LKRLTKAEKLLNEQMLALLEWAADHPKHWHDLGKLPEGSAHEINDLAL
jgi:hypothetical protein